MTLPEELTMAFPGVRGGAVLVIGLIVLLTSSAPVTWDGAKEGPLGGTEVGPEVPGDLPNDEPLNFPCQDQDHLPSEEALGKALGEEANQPSNYGVTLDMSPGVVPSATGSALEHSETNVQVKGVDEPDLVKTDGRYVYTISNGSVVIVLAYPPEDARVVARISLPDQAYWWGWYEGWWWGWSWSPASPSGLFLRGDRLVVFLHSYYTTVVPLTYNYTDWETGQSRSYTYNATLYHPLTQALVYDISDRAAPQLFRNVTVSGSFEGARMIGEYVYLVTSEYLYHYPDYPVILPAVWYDGWYYRVYASDVILPWGFYYPHNLVLLTSLSVEDRDTPESEALLVDSWTELYVSPHNIYVIGYDGWWWGPWFEDVWWGGWWLGTGNTTIHKYAISRGTFCFVGSGQVPGWPINAWAFDEEDGYLRVATETQRFDRWRPASPQSSNVYVLNETLARVSALEGIAPGEDMTAVRYLGDRAYLVTYGVPDTMSQFPSDPLFVVDLADPQSPALLGQLTIPGYSTYLHPFDETHLLGLGRDDCPGSTVQHPWWPSCLKLSLFDISDLAAPREVARYFVGQGDNEWSSSEAAWDPHAFLFIPSQGLLLIPVFWESWDMEGSQYRIFDGVYAFSVSPDRGFEVAWTDTHLGGPACPLVEYRGSGYSYSYFENSWMCDIERSLYIGDVAYTVSQALLRMRDLVSGASIGDVPLLADR